MPDADVARLVRAVHAGELTAAALLLDRLQELGDERKCKLNQLLGRLMGLLRYDCNPIPWNDFKRELGWLFWQELYGDWLEKLREAEGIVEQIMKRPI